jgi:hypothetical protein
MFPLEPNRVGPAIDALAYCANDLLGRYLYGQEKRRRSVQR